MSLENYIQVVGVLKKRGKNADNPDVKRPVLELEIARSIPENIVIDTAYVLLSASLISKNSVGYKTGDILIVTGSLHADEKTIYIDAKCIQRISNPTKKQRTLSAARSELLRQPIVQNNAVLTGIFQRKDDKEGFLRKRKQYLRGDLAQEDFIIAEFLTEDRPKIGSTCICSGQIGTAGECKVLYISDYKEVEYGNSSGSTGKDI